MNQRESDTCCATSHYYCDLRDSFCAHSCLIKESSTEMHFIRKYFSLFS